MKLTIVATCANVVKMVGLFVRSHFVVSDLLVVIKPFTTKVLALPVYDRSAVLYRCEKFISFLSIYNSSLYIYIYPTDYLESRQTYLYTKRQNGDPSSGRIALHSSANISPVTDMGTAAAVYAKTSNYSHSY